MYSEILENAKQTALKSGKLLAEGFGTNFKIDSKKTVNDLVTEYDKKSEDLIISELLNYDKSYCFLAEEGGNKGDYNQNTIRWIIDPLDGTVNFAHSIPIFSVSIAAEYQNEIIAGVVFNPITDEFFYASKENGAYFNEHRIFVSKNPDIRKSLLVTGFPYNVKENPGNTIELFAKIISSGIPVRRLGSAAIDLAYVAAGRFDGFWEIGLKPWDVAAGQLIVKEAGGKVTRFDGKKYSVFDNTILATNSLIHNDISVYFEKSNSVEYEN
jgi:myo-inositol-1(or 4)-monophosphatase